MKRFPLLHIPLLGILLAAPAIPVPAQTETPVTPDAPSSPARPAVALFGEGSDRALSITAFGVGSYTYDVNSNQNSFSPDAFAVAFSKLISDHFSIFAQLTAAREAPSPFLADAGESNDISTDIDNLQLSWVPSSDLGLEVTFGNSIRRSRSSGTTPL